MNSRVESNKGIIRQPACCKNHILPKTPFGLVMVGRSGSGKSTLLYNLLTKEDYLKGYFDYIFVYSPVKTDDILKQLDLPEENYISDFDEASVNHIMDTMENLLEDDFENNVNTHKVLFIFDDILQKQKFLKSDVIRKLASASRHFNISWIILTQYYRALPPIVRTNSSATVLFPSCLAEIDKFADEQCLPGMSKQNFIKMIQEATDQPYQFFYINCRAPHGQKARKGWDEILE